MNMPIKHAMEFGVLKNFSEISREAYQEGLIKKLNQDK